MNKVMEKIKPFVLFAGVIAAVLLVDLVTKAVFEDVYANFIPRVISIFSVHNFGVAWSMFSGGGVWLVLFTGALIIGASVVWVIIKRKSFKTVNMKAKAQIISDLGFAFFLGGALGNFIDRIVFGYVRDFIKFEFMNFPIFNVADICLNAGVVLLAVYFIFFFDDKKKSDERGKGKDES